MQSDWSPPRLVVYADYCCPFSYFLWHSLGEYWRTAEDPPSVDWRPFDVHIERRDRRGNLDVDAVTAFYERIAEAARKCASERDLEFDLDAVWGVDARRAHVGAVIVHNRLGSAATDRYHATMFDALWQDHRDISDPAVIVEATEEVGVSAEDVREGLDSDSAHRQLQATYENARDLGVAATPTMLYEGELREGVLDADEIASFVDGPV